MKKISLKFILLSLLSSTSFASPLSLTGKDADQMVSILLDSGIKPIALQVQAFSVICEAITYGVNNCLVSNESNDPATHRLFIPGHRSGQFWSLLKRAGVKSFISEVSDGTAGSLLIEAQNISCSFPNNRTHQCHIESWDMPKN